jgi:pyruvate kinase
LPRQEKQMPGRHHILRRRRAKIVATLGPSTSTPAMIEAILKGGADVFRLNFSHGDHADHAERLAIIRSLERKTGRPIGVLADVQGPKLRIGRFSNGHVILQKGQSFRLDLSPIPGDVSRVQLPHPEIIEAATPGMNLLIDDGKLKLRVDHVRPDHLETTVVVAGRLSDRKGVNVPDVMLPIPALTAKDRIDLAFALEQGVDFVGLSFVQRPEDVIEARELIAGRAWVLTKLEKPQALANLDEIIALSDAVMVARGDLGVELPPEEVPLAQRRIVRKAREMGRPVIVATQMMESMISSPTPTRAEASDVAGALFEGADAVMLSAETAAGHYPLEAVDMMDRILSRVERDSEWRAAMDDRPLAAETTSSGAIAAAARQVADSSGAKAIAAFTHGGSTALRIARQRPSAPILGLTPVMATARRLALVWGVHPVHIAGHDTMTQAVTGALSTARREGLATWGDEVVVTAGVPFNLPGTTNALRVATVTRQSPLDAEREN